jgi:acetoacetate decarboxylase
MEGFDYRRWTGTGTVNWHRATWEQLPLSFHIVNGIADLPVLEVVEAELVSFAGPGIAIAVNQMRTVETI